MIWQVLTLGFATLTFQYFAFVAILARFMSRIKINWLSLILLFSVSFFLSSLLSFDGIKFLLPEETANNYQDSAAVAASTSSIIVPVVRNLFFAFLIFFLLKDKTDNQLIRLLIWSALLSATMYVMTSGILVVAQRFSAYFGAAVPLFGRRALGVRARSVEAHTLGQAASRREGEAEARRGATNARAVLQPRRRDARWNEARD